MVQLAKHHDGRTLTRLEDIAQREAVSGNFLVQILNDLRRAGIIESRRGKSGGYLLARSPDAITLRQIVESVDPSLLQGSVASSGESGAAVQQAWERVSSRLQRELDQITLESLSSKPGASMFHI